MTDGDKTGGAVIRDDANGIGMLNSLKLVTGRQPRASNRRPRQRKLTRLNLVEER